MIGIYKITNKINNKCYIGQSINIERRWKEHLNDDIKLDRAIGKAFKKYGINNFTFEIIEICLEEQLDEKEIYWINYYNSYNNGYNMTLGGGGRICDYKYIIEQYKIYKTAQETAKACNCHFHTVSNALKSYNITPNANSLGVERPIKQINPTTLETINIFPSLAAAQKAFNVKNNCLFSRALKEHTIAYGFLWLDLNEDISVLKPITPKNNYKNKIILKISKDDNIILGEYKSVKEALASIGKQNGATGIYKALKGDRLVAYGYKWKVKEE